MAFNYIAAALKVKDIPPTEKFVLVALANHADVRDGTTFQGQEYLASVTGYGTATIFRALRSLEARGLIERKRGGSSRNGRHTDLTTLLIDVPSLTDSN